MGARGMDIDLKPFQFWLSAMQSIHMFRPLPCSLPSARSSASSFIPPSFQQAMLRDRSHFSFALFVFAFKLRLSKSSYPPPGPPFFPPLPSLLTTTRRKICPSMAFRKATPATLQRKRLPPSSRAHSRLRIPNSFPTAACLS